MKRVVLGPENVRLLFDYDPETGVVTRKAFPGLQVRGDGVIRGIKACGYMGVVIHGKHHYLHRVIWLWMTGEWPSHMVDHFDTNRSNNRWTNLRPSNSRENGQNQRQAHANSKTGLLGASPYVKNGRFSGKYVSFIALDGKRKHLGYYDTPEQAHHAYVSAKRIHHEGNTL